MGMLFQQNGVWGRRSVPHRSPASSPTSSQAANALPRRPSLKWAVPRTAARQPHLRSRRWGVPAGDPSNRHSNPRLFFFCLLRKVSVSLGAKSVNGVNGRKMHESKQAPRTQGGRLRGSSKGRGVTAGAWETSKGGAAVFKVGLPCHPKGARTNQLPQ